MENVRLTTHRGDKPRLKKHIMVFLEARYRGIQQLTMKNASAAENARTTARSACTNSKRTKEKRSLS